MRHVSRFAVCIALVAVPIACERSAPVPATDSPSATPAAAPRSHGGVLFSDAVCAAQMARRPLAR